MAIIGGKKGVNPFYRAVSDDVKAELNYRASSYGARVRTGTTTKVKIGSETVEEPEVNKILWSYGKTAYAIIKGGSITLGSSYSRVMSDVGGNLTLYDSTRNQPKYPLLQSVELSNEGQLGSLLKGSFTFTIYPDISASGFIMENIESAFFTPGKEVTITYGWSVRNKGASNGSLTGIIYNFDWSVNPDLSITAKCSIVSKATIAIGVSGEQTTPSEDGGSDAQKDPLGQPIPNGDIAGVIERDVKNLGGINNTSVTTGQTNFYNKDATTSKKLAYYVIGMPMSLVDLDNAVLTKEQQQKKQQYEAQQKYVDAKNELARKETANYLSNIIEYKKRIEDADDSAEIEFDFVDSDGTIKSKAGTKADALAAFERVRAVREKAIIDGLIDIQKSNNVNGDPKVLENARKQFLAQVKADAAKAAQAKKDGASGATDSAVTPTVSTTPYGSAKQPPPITHPIYYVKLGDLTEYVNDILRNSPLGKELFRITCFENTTQHLEDIVSSAPEEVFFPDEKMGAYGQFIPFNKASSLQLQTGNNSLIDIGNILISTSAIIRVYRSFVKENQTSIEYKNITGFFDELIKLINYASGEMYQLVTHLIDPDKGTGGKAQLSIEDTHISKAVAESVRPPYEFTATIARPLLKSISISCKPPAASAAAAFTLARGGGATVQTDVRFDKAGQSEDFKAARVQINDQKDKFAGQGAGKTFSTGMKGNFSRYKKSATYNPGATNAHWLRKVIYPIDLSLTIDGIDGFKFGDVIKTNLVPSRYNAEKLVFVITKINHTIQNGVWETTLNTKSRIEPQ
jgi:hypothetical protein